jgi:hypothetical protein
MKFVPLNKVDSSEYKELPLDLFSFDDGYNAKKAFSTRMPQGVVLHTQMGRTSARMTTSRAILGTEGIQGAELREENGPMRYLFGHHAAKQFGAEHLTSKSSDDLVGQVNTKLVQFFRATLSMAFPVPGRYRANGVVMMPVRAIKNDPGFKDAVREALEGVHQFKALTGFDPDTGEPKYGDWDILVKNIMVVEQPLGSMFKVALDPESNGPDINILQSAKNAFLDWGKGTLDIFVTDVSYSAAGKPSIERVDNMCESASAGISMLYDYIRSEVLEPASLNPTDVVLERAIMAGRYKDNRRVNLRSPLADERGYIDLVPYIEAAIETMWLAALELFDETIGLSADSIDNIFITGGPAGWMQPKVIEHFGEHRVFKAMPDDVAKDPVLPYKHLMLSEDLHLRNAHGGFLLALKKAGRLDG